MKKDINKRIILIVALACICLIVIVATLVFVRNRAGSNDEEKIIDSNYEANGSAVSDIGDYDNEDASELEINDNFNSDMSNFGENEVVKCQRQILTDPQTGVAVMSLMVPEGWKTSIQVDWTYMNQTSPGRAFVVLSSPDGKIELTYVSHMSFVQTNADNYVGNYNRNALGVATELDYMTASEYSNHMLEAGKVTMLTTENTYVDSDKEENIRNYAAKVGQEAYEFVRASADTAMQGVSSMQTSVDLTGCDGQISIQHGPSNINGTNGYTETICEEIMYEITTNVYFDSIMGRVEYPSIVKTWEPYLLTIANFTDEATYKENYDLYRFLVSNMVLCADFEYLNYMLGSQYMEKAIQANIEITNYAYEIMSQSQQENMQQSDAFVNNFCDYIYDQTTYTMSDGSSVAVPTSADYVYSDGNDVIWTNSALFEPGAGYTQIN